MKSLIINADDFGKSNSINYAIDMCMKEKYISSTTLMVNMPYTREAVKLAFEGNYADKVGLHINLTEGIPITEGMRNNDKLVTGEEFNKLFHRNIITRFIMSRENMRCIRDEIEEQIKIYIELLGNKANMHLDSHHHVHTDYVVFKSIEPLISKYGIKSIRLSRTLSNEEFGFMKRLYKEMLNNRIRNSTFYCTDEMGTFKDYFECRNKIENNKIIELECHPDYKNGALINVCQWADNHYCSFKDYLEIIGKYQIITWR